MLQHLILERVHDLSTIYQKCHICLEIHIDRGVKNKDLFCRIRAKNRIVGPIAIRNADYFRLIRASLSKNLSPRPTLSTAERHFYLDFVYISLH